MVARKTGWCFKVAGNSVVETTLSAANAIDYIVGSADKVLLHLEGEGAVGPLGGGDGIWREGRADQGIPEGNGSCGKWTREGRGKCVWWCILLEVAEVASDDLLDVDAGGMV
eukprot:g25082.t1